ncbi:MAG: (4Fe-4S)-binding protein [Nitrososphaeraceae archaeon]
MEVTWDDKICTHSGNCVKNLPSVFKVESGKFIIIQDGASKEQIQKTVNDCPSGALKIK